MSVLVGDIGGTNLRLATFEQGNLTSIESVRNVTVDHWSTPILDYAKRFGPFSSISLGVAGPVMDGEAQLMNHAWKIDAKTLSAELQIPVLLLNDFHAQAFAVPRLTPAQWEGLDDLTPRAHGHIALLGAGTGLGEAVCVWTGQSYFPVAGEGSHGRFGPQNERQIQLLRGLMTQWPHHVSVERVVSGPGLVNTYDVLRGPHPRHPKLKTMDPAAAITQLGLAEECPIATETLEIFVDVLADEAASLALKCNATEVYLSGGIPPRIPSVLHRRFRSAFEKKGRYQSMMAGIPVRLITEDNMGLLGAGYATEHGA